MYLFMTYVGGYNDRTNIELHDVRFVIGQTIEACFPDLRKQWWGSEKMFHLDAWGKVEYVEDYEVSIRREPADHSEKLYFVNLGGYDPTCFTELHKNVLVIAKGEMEAKVKAKSQIQDWKQPHKDNCFEVEKILELTHVGDYHIHLKRTNHPKPFEFTCAFKGITRKV